MRLQWEWHDQSLATNLTSLRHWKSIEISECIVKVQHSSHTSSAAGMHYIPFLLFVYGIQSTRAHLVSWFM